LGVVTILIGVVSDLMAASRHLMEDVQYRLRKMELERLEDEAARESQQQRRVSAPWVGGGNS
jgi:hypothetical protein